MPSDAGPMAADVRPSAPQLRLLAGHAERAVPPDLASAATDFDCLAGALCRRLSERFPPGVPPAVPAQAACFMSVVRRINAETRSEAPCPAGVPVNSPYRQDPMFLMLQRCARAWPDFVASRVPGVNVVFPKGDRELWAQMQARSLHMRGYADAIGAAVGSLMPDARQILEIGAGSGAATGAVLGRAGGAVPARYVVTDISPTLLRDIRATFPAGGMECAVYDFTRPPSALGQFDIVFGANALHCAPDVRSALGNVLELVAPGGYLVLAEGTRPLSGRAWRPELVFSLLPGWWQVETDPQTRRTAGFLSEGEWRTVFGLAGYPDAAVLPIGSASSVIIGSLIVARKGMS